MTEPKLTDEDYHRLDRQFYMESLTTVAFAGAGITIEEYELHRDANLEELVSFIEAKIEQARKENTLH